MADSNANNIEMQYPSVLFYECKDVIRIFYDEDNGLIIHEWLDYNPEGQDSLIIEVLQKIYEIFLDTSARKVLVKADQTRGVFSLGVNKYIREIQFPRLIDDTELKFVATIINKNDMNSRYAEIWKGHLKQNAPLILHDVSSEAEGRAWLKQFD
tara:strand:+ start:54365 stop:54826 length:462 start_codon:yes stop_codon:yes gene_type:complete